MEKIAVKTKIKVWSVTDNKEKIEFETLDLSPDQVADVDRLIRNNKTDHVRLTIEPENKQLRFAMVTSNVRLTGMQCLGKGQKIEVSDFKSANDRAGTMKDLINGDTLLLVTLEQIQGQMFDESEDPNTKSLSAVVDGSQGPKEYQVNENGVIVDPEVIEVKLPKNYGAMVAMSLGRSNDNWYFGFKLEIGHDSFNNPCSNDGGENIYTAMGAAKAEIFKWIDLHKDYKYAKQAKAKIEKTLQKWELENS